MIDAEALAAEARQIVERDGASVVAAVHVAGERCATVVGGAADRRFDVPNTVETRFGLASGTKGFTALTVLSLVADGALGLDQPVRDVLGADLPEIDAAVTVEHLLAHRSGIGDYLDEDELDDPSAYVMPVPVHQLDSTESYLAVLDGHAQVFAPGQRFAYNNSGYVVLALVAERVAGVAFERLVDERVAERAGLRSTAFERSDALPADVATGYLDHDGLRTNVLHLPVLGSGDGGLTSTVDDVDRLWRALFRGDIIPSELVSTMTTSRSTFPSGNRYGLGLWLAPTTAVVALEGADAGISFRSVHDPTSNLTTTVISNTSSGAWSVARVFDDAMFG